MKHQGYCIDVDDSEFKIAKSLQNAGVKKRKNFFTDLMKERQGLS